MEMDPQKHINPNGVAQSFKHYIIRNSIKEGRTNDTDLHRSEVWGEDKKRLIYLCNRPLNPLLECIDCLPGRSLLALTGVDVRTKKVQTVFAKQLRAVALQRGAAEAALPKWEQATEGSRSTKRCS